MKKPYYIDSVILATLFFVNHLGLVREVSGQLPESRQMASDSFSAQDDPIYGVWQETTTLRSIVNITEDRLVAVGDRGTILLTMDAGHTWKLVASPTTVNLSDVYYDGRSIWAVGGWIGNKTGSSHAALLKSEDGGLSWRIQPTPSLPRLTGIHVLGSQIICWGDFCSQRRSSVYSSLDGGLSWQAVVKGTSHIAAACVSSDGKLLAVDTLGRAVDSQRQNQLLTTPDRPIHTILSTTGGWLAGGEGGVLISSRDGVNWSDIQLPISQSLVSLCDWVAAEALDNHIWLAGSPGSIVFHSQDHGRTWSGYPTGQTLPLRKLCFVDAQRGWAVGAQGTLLATRDGGRSWYPQRQQPTRVALLSVNRSPLTIPWPALISTMWDHHQSATAIAVQHIEPLAQADSKPSSESSNIQFARRIGLSDCTISDCRNDPPAKADLRLALQIAIWRPDVLLSSLNVSEPLSESQLPSSLSRAMQLAGSDNFASNFETLFLKPWQAQKLVEVVESGRGDYSEQTQKVLRGTGLTISEVMWLLPESEQQRQAQVNMRTIWSRSQSRAVQVELMGGTSPNPDTRLIESQDSLGSYQSIMGRVQREKMLKQLFRSEESEVSLEDWKREFLFFAQALPYRDRSRMLSSVIGELAQLGQHQRMQLVLEWIMRSDPSNDLARWAGLQSLGLLSNGQWLSRTTSDLSELAQSSHKIPGRAGRNLPISNDHFEALTVATADFRFSDTESRSVASPFTDDLAERDLRSSNVANAGASLSQSQVITASAERPVAAATATQLAASEETHPSWRLSIDQVLKLQPELRFEPQVIMLLASHHRKCGDAMAAQSLLNELIEQPEIVTWHQAARQELAVLTGQDSDWRKRAQAALAAIPPKLDGQLDEIFWSAGTRMELDSLNPSSDEPAIVKWAYDQDYLYIGLVCPRSKLFDTNSRSAPQVVQQREYDADLNNLNRVEISLDPHRDYNTSFQFSVAENGLTQDCCMSSRAYNPKWHVKVISQPDQWRAEIAIPCIELGTSRIRSGDRWAVSARRLGPGQSPQSWSQLRTHLSMPQANGLLHFE